MIPREISLEYSASEFGLDCFIRLDKEAIIDRHGIGRQGVVEIGLRAVGTELEVETLGAFFKATVIEEFTCDLQNGKLRT